MDPISTEKFYGRKVKNEKSMPSSKIRWVKIHRTMPSHILGPTQYWQEFYKQADALATAAERSTKTDTLCTFVYQRTSDGTRRFVVAHPEVYWWYYKARAQTERCSYEVRRCFVRIDVCLSVEREKAHDAQPWTIQVPVLPRGNFSIVSYDRTCINILRFNLHRIFEYFKKNLFVGHFLHPR